MKTYKYDVKFYDKYNNMYHIYFRTTKRIEYIEIRSLCFMLLEPLPENTLRIDDEIEIKIEEL